MPASASAACAATSRATGTRKGEQRDVVEAEPVAEIDRRRIASVLAADAEPEVGPRLPAALDRDAHEVAHPRLIERLERVVDEDALLEIAGEERSLGVIARESERGLREVVRSEREEVRVFRDLIGAHAGAWQLDHGAARVVDAAFFLDRAGSELAKWRELLGEGDERVHDLDVRRRAGAPRDGLRCAHDGAHLHLVDLRPLQTEPAAARSQHRVGLVQRDDPLPHALVGRLFGRRQELVQRRIEQADGHREPGHGFEDALEVALLHGQQPVERCPAFVLVGRHDHLAHDRQAFLGHEHVLGAAEADPFGTELPRLACVGRRVGVRVHAEAAHAVGPREQCLEISLMRGGTSATWPMMTIPAVPSIVIASPSATSRPPKLARRRSRSITSSSTPATHGLPMPRATTAACEVMPPNAVTIPCGLDEPVDVGGGGLRADEDHALARLAARLGGVGIEHDDAARRARGGVQPRRGDVELHAGIEHRMEQLVELGRIDAADRLLAVDQPLVDHRDGSFDRRSGRALGRARLQQVQAPVLDRELDVLHVAVVPLEARIVATSSSKASGIRSRSLAIGSGVRMPATTSSPWASRRNSP